MNIECIACDYDRTLTDESLAISEGAMNALKDASQNGVKVIIVSGRVLRFLKKIYARYNFIDAVVAENGAVIYFPKEERKILLGNNDECEKSKAVFSHCDFPVSIQEVIIATTTDYDTEVKNLIKQNNLSADIEYNKDSLMVMPKGINKGRGILEAIKLLGIAQKKLACIGDGENDVSLLDGAGTKVAVANAVEIVKRKADILTEKPYGEGVKEFVKQLVKR